MIKIPGYKITKTIGRGGMATVYLATQESIGREVAIKIMSPALASDPSFSDRFVKEARMANLSHPNIVTVYDAGAVDGVNYIIMEYANGGNLDTAIKQGISIYRTLEVMKQISSALDYSCTKGFIHRDVKPENIIFREDGSAVLMDFGIAKAISSGTQLTMVGSTIGSPNYMSPEQARGLDLDGRSDLYSLGIVFFEALTGTKPYDASDTFVIGLKHINDPLPQLPGKLQEFQPLIEKLLAKLPEGRFDNGNQFIEALEKFDFKSNDINNDIHKIASQSGTEDTHVNYSRHAQTKNSNTVVNDPTQQTAELNQEKTQAVEIEDESDKTQILYNNQNTDDKTQIYPENFPYDDKTRVTASHKTDEIDNTIISPKVQSAITEKSSNKKMSLVASLIVLLMAGGVYFWSIYEQEQIPSVATTPDNIPTKTPIENSKPQTIKSAISKTELINNLLQKASHAMTTKKFTTPDGDNAFKYYSNVLKLDKNNKDALKGINSIAERYHDLAEAQFKSQNLTKALDLISTGLMISPEHQKLIALNKKIKHHDTDIKNKPGVSTKQYKSYKSLISKDTAIKNVEGSHTSKNRKEATLFAQQNITNKIYNLILMQCNSSNKHLNSPECIRIYKNYIKHWPLPLKGISEQVESTKTTISFNSKKLLNTYKSQLKILSQIFNDSNKPEKDKILALANYVNYQSIASLLGLKTQDIDLKATDTYMSSQQTINSKILTTQELNDFVLEFINNKQAYLSPITSKNSLEVTPFASEIYKSLPSAVKQNQATTKNRLFIDYDLKSNGDVSFNFWLFNNKNELTALNSVILDSTLLNEHRKSSHIYNNDIIPQKRLKSSYGFPASIAMNKQTNNPLLLIGKSTSLNIKLSQSGFYFIAIHVIHADDQYSYLLPLSQEDIPFVNVLSHENIQRFIELGKFEISPPTGVEVLQLIASNVNLEKYLPDNHWDDKRKQFIINGSEGNMQKGLTEVRNYLNTLSEVSRVKDAKWQEKLLITSILNN